MSVSSSPKPRDGIALFYSLLPYTISRRSSFSNGVNGQERVAAGMRQREPNGIMTDICRIGVGVL